MFSRNDYRVFVMSLLLILSAYIMMGMDPVENGFGVLTLWIAPPVLLTGFLLPVAGILGLQNIRSVRLKLNTIKHIAGLGVFIVALTTYLLTLEPTASLWDCSEFIASAFKLQVPHTPGTPLSLLIGRLFTMLAGSDVTRVAWTLNAMSGLFSAMTVLVLYHIIYHLSQRLFAETETNRDRMSIAGSVCGSLSLTFCDTFWFSAVEAETYGAACFFLVLLVFMIMKGVELNEPFRSRWLVLICYTGGLAYCIHPMCVLALPLLPFVWSTRDKTLTIKNTLLPVAVGLLMVLSVNRVIGIGTFELAFAFDRYFVNSLGLPFYSGALFLGLIIVAVCIYLLKNFSGLRPYTWSFIFLMVGFMPYIMLFVRSNQDPPIDETNPEDLAMIKAYMNRESYPSSPLIYGQYFDAQVEEITVKKNIYHRTENDYSYSGIMPEYRYQTSRSTVLPRMHSNDPDHVESYRLWAGLKKDEKPDFIDNVSFLFTYQLGHMYMRYLMFNFAGRESDQQNDDWLRPWSPLHISDNVWFENKARNQYWMLPLLLGLAGIYIQARKDRKGFVSVSVFFLITGVILALYLNSPPVEPRERDYIYVGSFIAYCIWIGLGISAIYYGIKKLSWAPAISATVALCIPILIVWQTYDDHDRSGRTYQVDNARNLLSSCAPNSILFTGGDNDTFPLWYLQEVEGFRTDVRVMVLSYMNTDWYINQLRKAYYNSPAFKFTLDRENYLQYGPNDVLYIQESIKNGIDLKKYLELLKVGNPALRVQASTGDSYNILPSKSLRLKIDTPVLSPLAALAVSTNPTVTSNEVPSEISFHVNGNYLQKNALAILDLLVSNGWTRPIYFNYTSLNTAGMMLDNHVVQEGNVYRLAPLESKNGQISIDRDLMYQNLIEKADYSNLLKKGVYYNYEDYHARMITPVRQSLNQLAIEYLKAGEMETADKVMQFALDKLYPDHLIPSYTNLQAADILFTLNRNDAAATLCTQAFDYAYEHLVYARSAGRAPENLDVFLAENAAEILSKIGDDQYVQKLKLIGFAD